MKLSPGQVRLRTLILVAFLAGLLGLGTWWLVRHRTGARHHFSKLWNLYSFNPNVAATSYESKRGGATVIWISGLDDASSSFGEVWHVYSYTNAVTASVYDSAPAGATIIWLSGTDEDPRSATNSPPHPKTHGKPPPKSKPLPKKK